MNSSSLTTLSMNPHANRILRRGDRGALVKHLQTKLKREDLDIACDGIFGAATELAVKIYQTGQHLHGDGIVGPKTWTQLDDSG